MLSTVGVAGLGCGGGGVSYKDATVPSDSKGGSDSGPDGGTTNPDSSGTVDSGADGLPAPMMGAGSKLVVAGGSFELVGNGNDTCTNQVPYSTDRWCAFAKPATSLGNSELWVINATALAAGTTIKCDTTDANCLRMTSGLLDDQNFHFRAHRFDGDTLIFSEGTSQMASGDIFAWRPGWSGPRKIAAVSGELCIGSKTSTTVMCVDNVQIDSTMSLETADFHVGTVDDANGDVLPKVDTFVIATKNDSQSDLQRYAWQISPDGQYVAWSGRYTIDGPEQLKLLKVGETTATMVTEDVSVWSISKDMTKWYWLRAFNYDGTGLQSGSLESAPFPAGTPTKSLVGKVGDYVEAGPKGLVIRTGFAPYMGTGVGVGTMTLMADREAPGQLTTLDTGVITIFDVTPDGTKFMYAKNEESIQSVLNVYDLYVTTPTATKPCVLATSANPTAFADPTPPSFLSSGSVAVFGRLDPVTGAGEGLYLTVDQCKAYMFSNEIYAWLPIGDQGYVYSDDLTAVNQTGETTLRYAQATNGALPASGTSVQTRSGLTFAPLLPALHAVMYTVSGGTAADGLYINASLPFTTTPPVAPPDGGTTPPPSDGGGGDTSVEAPPASDAAPDTGGGSVDAGADTGTTG